MVVDASAKLVDSDVHRGLVRNQARLTYSEVARWLEGSGPAPAPAERVDGIEEQVRLQDQIATKLQARRDEEGALDFDRSELRPIVDDRGVRELRTETPNRAKELIENFMIAANGVTARFLSARGLSSIRRVVRSPERWPRIVELAARHGERLPPDPDARALQQFLKNRRATAPDDY